MFLQQVACVWFRAELRHTNSVLDFNAKFMLRGPRELHITEGDVIKRIGEGA